MKLAAVGVLLGLALGIKIGTLIARAPASIPPAPPELPPELRGKRVMASEAAGVSKSLYTGWPKAGVCLHCETNRRRIERVAADLLGNDHLCCNMSRMSRKWGHWRDLLAPLVHTMLANQGEGSPMRKKAWPGNASQGLAADLPRHVYEFGVGMGSSLYFLHRSLRLGRSGHHHDLPRLEWVAFDSFDGLPSNDGMPITNASDPPPLTIPSWRPGAYSFDPRKQLRTFFGSVIQFVPGFYADSLSEVGLVERLRMRPALYVDIDADLYGSSVLALDFMMRHGLVRPGTLIGYDDWWVLPCAKGAEQMASLGLGEARAHAEAATRFDIEFRCVAGPCRYQTPRRAGDTAINLHTHLSAWGVIMQVVSIGQGRASHGFEMTTPQELGWKRFSVECQRTLGERNSVLVRPKQKMSRTPNTNRSHVSAMEGQGGYCGVTVSASGCNEDSDDGSWPLSKKQATSWGSAKAACEGYCRRCARCKYISFSRRNLDCSWFARCKLSQLSNHVGGFRTLQVTKANVA